MMIIITLVLYNLFFPILFILYLPVFLSKLAKRGGFKEGFFERFGIFSATKKDRFKNIQKPIWIHAVSVGETIAALSFIREWLKKEPDIHFVLSTTTSTGQKIARDQSPGNVIPIYCPLDYCVFVWNAIKTIRPQMLIIFEVEIWPNLIVLAARQKIKLALVNCRMSDKSARNYSRFKWFFNYIFSKFSIICAQTEEDAVRIKNIIGDKPFIKVSNNMKFDQAPNSKNNNFPILINHIFPDRDRTIFIAASTHPGEEIIMVRAFKSLVKEFPALQFILAPRHAERTSEVEKILQKEDINYVLLSELKKLLKYNDKNEAGKVDNREDKNKRVLLVNTTGELVDLLAVSDIVFVGKSLGGNKGGHNIIEPAIFGKSIIFGRNMENFRRVVQIFKKDKAAVEVRDEKEFLQVLHSLVSDPVKRERLGKKSLATVKKNQGAIEKTIEFLRKN